MADTLMDAYMQGYQWRQGVDNDRINQWQQQQRNRILLDGAQMQLENDALLRGNRLQNAYAQLLNDTSRQNYDRRLREAMEDASFANEAARLGSTTAQYNNSGDLALQQQRFRAALEPLQLEHDRTGLRSDIASGQDNISLRGQNVDFRNRSYGNAFDALDSGYRATTANNNYGAQTANQSTEMANDTYDIRRNTNSINASTGLQDALTGGAIAKVKQLNATADAKAAQNSRELLEQAANLRYQTGAAGAAAQNIEAGLGLQQVQRTARANELLRAAILDNRQSPDEIAAYLKNVYADPNRPPEDRAAAYEALQMQTQQTQAKPADPAVINAIYSNPLPLAAQTYGWENISPADSTGTRRAYQNGQVVWAGTDNELRAMMLRQAGAPDAMLEKIAAEDAAQRARKVNDNNQFALSGKTQDSPYYAKAGSEEAQQAEVMRTQARLRTALESGGLRYDPASQQWGRVSADGNSFEPVPLRTIQSIAEKNGFDLNAAPAQTAMRQLNLPPELQAQAKPQRMITLPADMITGMSAINPVGTAVNLATGLYRSEK